MVIQEPYLFDISIRANLLDDKPGATQEELDEACSAANLHDFISSLPNGYDTNVGKRGYRLSKARNNGWHKSVWFSSIHCC